ncbi:hypothetical protein GCM10009801_21310 [Streptomyces albiaxialis]|uniref:Uncharacterized protein n=1 Tax=Streptomyces albiaxialis TaxID=329523 RepID=A0ABN2VTS0_9ACTN
MAPPHNPYTRHVDPRGPSAIRQNSPPEDRSWRYDFPGESPRIRRFTGRALYVGGAEGERLRGELAEVTHQLLTWAAEQRSWRWPSEGQAP